MSLVGGRRHCNVIETQRPERQEELQTVTQKTREWGQRQSLANSSMDETQQDVQERGSSGPKNLYLYGPFLPKLPYYHQKMKLVLDRFCSYKFYFFYMIMDRCIYLNQDHFVTKLNNCFLICGRTFYPQKLITVTMEKCNC